MVYAAATQAGNPQVTGIQAEFNFSILESVLSECGANISQIFYLEQSVTDSRNTGHQVSYVYITETSVRFSTWSSQSLTAGIMDIKSVTNH